MRGSLGVFSRSQMPLRCGCFVVLASLLWLPNLLAAQQPEKNDPRIKLVLRIDDYSAWPRRLPLWKQLLIDVTKRDLAATIGVIPNRADGNVESTDHLETVPLTEESAKPLVTAMATGKIEAALHGYTHQTRVSTAPFTEFSGRPFAEQLQLITAGKAELERVLPVKIRTFIPPWNSYDDGTLLAAEQAGLQAFSASASSVPQTNSSLCILPYTCDIDEVREAVATARQSDYRSPVIIVLMHLYDIKEFDAQKGTISHDDFIKTLDWIRSQDDIGTYTIDEIARQTPASSMNHYSQVAQLRNCDIVLARLFPPWFRTTKQPEAFYPTVICEDHALWYKVLGLYAFTLLMSIVISKVVSQWILSRIPLLAWPALTGAIASFLATFGYGMRHATPTYRGMLSATCCLGFSIGIYLVLRQIRHRRRSTTHEHQMVESCVYTQDSGETLSPNGGLPH